MRGLLWQRALRPPQGWPSPPPCTPARWHCPPQHEGQAARLPGPENPPAAPLTPAPGVPGARTGVPRVLQHGGRRGGGPCAPRRPWGGRGDPHLGTPASAAHRGEGEGISTSWAGGRPVGSHTWGAASPGSLGQVSSQACPGAGPSPCHYGPRPRYLAPPPTAPRPPAQARALPRSGLGAGFWPVALARPPAAPHGTPGVGSRSPAPPPPGGQGSTAGLSPGGCPWTPHLPWRPGAGPAPACEAAG